MDIKEYLLRAINDSMDNKGLVIEKSSVFKSDFFEVSKEVENGNIRTYLNGDVLDSHMFLYTFAEMLKHNEINIIFNENATNHNKDYLKKLSESLK